MMRYSLRKDANQAAIVEGLRAVGATIKVLHVPGDLLVGYQERNYLLEVKRQKTRGRKTMSTPEQLKFQREWRGQYAIVYTLVEALEVIGARAKW